MNWLTNVVRPKIRNILRRETPENLADSLRTDPRGSPIVNPDLERKGVPRPG